jgi:hypothetical protein
MNCYICNGNHPFGESCPGGSSDSLSNLVRSLNPITLPYEPPPLLELNKPFIVPVLPSYGPPSYELPKPIIPSFETQPLIDFNKTRYEPALPAYEPPSYELPKPIIPSFETQPLIDFNKTRFEPVLPAYEPPSYELPKPFIPSFETQPLIDFNKTRFEPVLPSYESSTPKLDFLSRFEPVIPPPTPVYNIHHDLIGWKPEFENHINLGIGGNGTRLDIDPGGFVRDPIGNLVGQMGALNTIVPPSFPSMPDYGPPQSTPDAWSPGFSPMQPFG